MKNFIVIISVILSFFIYSFPQASEKDNTADKNIVSSEIIHKIKKEGAHKVVNELYEDESKWDELLRNVASGDKSWLEVATYLRQGTDAGATEMLDIAVGGALENNPRAVLLITLNVFQVWEICNGPDVVNNEKYDTFKKAKDAVERRIRALNTITDENLIEKRNLCIKELNKSVPHLQNYFEKLNN
jgi:hypothetical protein